MGHFIIATASLVDSFSPLAMSRAQRCPLSRHLSSSSPLTAFFKEIVAASLGTPSGSA